MACLRALCVVVTLMKDRFVKKRYLINLVRLGLTVLRCCSVVLTLSRRLSDRFLLVTCLANLMCRRLSLRPVAVFVWMRLSSIRCTVWVNRSQKRASLPSDLTLPVSPTQVLRISAAGPTARLLLLCCSAVCVTCWSLLQVSVNMVRWVEVLLWLVVVRSLATLGVPVTVLLRCLGCWERSCW